MKSTGLIFFVLLFISCNREPQPLVAGKDECDFCKMPMMDIKFGGEIITAKGKIYKFDDIGCMLDFLKSELGPDEKAKTILAANYVNNQKLMDVNDAVFLKNTNLHTPMNSGIVAFQSRTEAELYLKEFPSEILTWQQFQTDLK